MQPWEWGEEGEFEHLSRFQQRQLRKLIENQSALDEDDFDLTPGDGEWAGFIGGYTDVPVIIYEPEQFFFGLTYFDAMHDGVEYIPAGHAIYFKPGEQALNERHMRVDWDQVRRHFAAWLGYIARELDLDYEADEDEPDEDEENEADEVLEEPAPVAVGPPKPEPIASETAPVVEVSFRTVPIRPHRRARQVRETGTWRVLGIDGIRCYGRHRPRHVALTSGHNILHTIGR